MKPLLLGLALLLGGVLTLQWLGWAPEAGLPAPPPARQPGENTNAPATAALDRLTLEPPPKEEYASVVQRPLFLPERRPPPEAEEDEPLGDEAPLTELDGLDLTAVVITPTVVSAWVRNPENPELKRLRLGQDYMGWTVKTIEPARLVLERQGETNELPLRDYDNAPSPIPPTRLPPPRRAAVDRPDEPSKGRRGGDGQAPADAAADDAERRPARQQPGRAAREPARQLLRQPPRRAPTRRTDATGREQ